MSVMLVKDLYSFLFENVDGYLGKFSHRPTTSFTRCRVFTLIKISRSVICKLRPESYMWPTVLSELPVKDFNFLWKRSFYQRKNNFSIYAHGYGFHWIWLRYLEYKVILNILAALPQPRWCVITPVTLFFKNDAHACSRYFCSTHRFIEDIANNL